MGRHKHVEEKTAEMDHTTFVTSPTTPTGHRTSGPTSCRVEPFIKTMAPTSGPVVTVQTRRYPYKTMASLAVSATSSKDDDGESVEGAWRG